MHRAVREALAERRAVVALETTVVTHGLPRPENLETALAMEQAIAREGALGAFIGLLGGQIHIGLTPDELEHLARAEQVEKTSRRDLPLLLTLGRDGATTVAGTMACAALAGIAVMATGGIGGVHRDVQTSMDISADLTELGATAVAVVCSGVKSILDIARTRERLETLGVPVIGYQTDRFPAFYVRDSGLAVDARLDSPDAVAELIVASREVGNAGLLVTQPVSVDEARDPTELEDWVGQAERTAQARGIRGKSLTPFLLGELFRLSGGKTLRANQALLVANATLAARIAVALEGRRKGN